MQGLVQDECQAPTGGHAEAALQVGHHTAPAGGGGRRGRGGARGSYRPVAAASACLLSGAMLAGLGAYGGFELPRDPPAVACGRSPRRTEIRLKMIMIGIL